jgi:putative FmdB family regulatory protein
MPTYEYECTKGHRFEVEQSMRDPALRRCKVCRSKAQRLISASSFILKGGGWYSDGYGSSKPNASKSESSGGESKSEGKSEAKSESKSESTSSSTKTETKSDAKPAAKSDSKPSGGSAASAGT